MRPDFNKLLVERERIGHRNSYKDNRKHKAFDVKDSDGPIGGRESMKARHVYAWGGKRFNENLRPLKNWLHSVLGKNWDKSYSELRQTFDARSVINNHILEHLFHYVEVNAKVINGKVMVLKAYGGKRFTETQGYVPVSECQSEYYVCPKDGTLKKSSRETYKSIMASRKAREAAELFKVKRVIDADNELHLIDGTWFHFTLKDLPPSESEYICPPQGRDGALINIGWLGKPKFKAWADFNEDEIKRFGVKSYTGGSVYDVLAQKTVWKEDYHYSKKRYYATKKTASKKQLRNAGIS